MQRSFYRLALVICGWAALLGPTPGATKEKINIGIMVPDHSFMRRAYSRAMFRALSDMRKDYNMLLPQKFTLFGELMYTDKYSPPELLESFCERILNSPMNTILYMSNTDYEGKHTASGQYVLQVSNFLGIPVIAWNGDNSGFFQPTAESIILQMAPSIEHQCRAMLSLLRRYKWHAFTILTGSMAGEVHFVNNLRELADTSDINFEIMAVIRIPRDDSKIISDQMDKLKMAETRVILLYSSKKEAEVILEIASQKGLTGKEYVWVVSQSIVGDLSSSKEAPFTFPIGLFGIYFKTDDDALTKAIYTGVTVWGQGLESMLQDSLSKPKLQNVTLKPNLSCSNQSAMRWQHGRIVYDYLRNVSIDNDYPAISFNEDGIIQDTELQIINVNPDREWETIGQWNLRDGITIDDITWPGDTPTPPKGRPSKYQLKVVTIKESPYVIYSDPDPKTGNCPSQAALCRIASLNETLGVPNATANASLYQCCSGLCIDLLKMLAEKMGFEFDLFQVEDKKFGAYDKDTGEWNGLVRAVMDQKADMSIASLSITQERNQQIDFSVPFLETGITIIVAVRDGVISPTAFLEPYDYPSWCLILVFSVHASGAAIFIYEWLSPSGLDRGNKPIREHRFSLFRSFWLIWSMLFGAAVNTDNPRGVSSRFMSSIWALFALVFTASYTANLAAFMITKEDYDRLSGIQDWRLTNPYSHKPPFKFATVPHGSTEANLRNNYNNMYKYMRPYNKSTVIEGVRAVKEHEINAFLYDATVLEYLAGHDDGCKLRTVGNWYAMTGYGLGFPRGSKWLPIVNKYLIQLQHNGEMERLQKFWLAGACSQRTEEGESSMPLGILNFTSAFILLAGGMLLGGILLLLEHIYFKFFRRKLRKWDKCGCCGLVSLSMGKSLTFEQSVREAVELQKSYKCKNPICETQMWKVKHELDLALLRIDRLQKQLGENGITPEKRAVWKDNRNKGPPPAIGWKDSRNRGPPPQIGWKAGPGGKDSGGWGQEAAQYPKVPAPSYDMAMTMDGSESRGAEPPGGITVGQRTPPAPARHRQLYNKKGSKSLPSSPVKSKTYNPWRPEPPPAQEPKYNESMKRATSFPNTRSANNSPAHDKNKKTRYHKGQMYVEVGDDSGGPVEIETVL